MYDALIQLLEATGIPCAEGAWNRAPQTGSYIVYALDGQGESLWADDAQQQQAIQGSVDLFCRTAERAQFNAVQNALRASGLSWDLYSIQREPENRLIHYEWVFEMEVL